MAAWQFDLHLIPEAKIVEMVGEVPDHLDEGLTYPANLWEGHQPPPSINQCLASFLKQAASWSENVALWGEENGNRVDVLYEGRDVADIFVRINAYERDDAFLEGIIRLAREYKAVFWAGESEEVIRPNTAALISALKRSRAYSFAQDPEGFLSGLGDERVH